MAVTIIANGINQTSGVKYTAITDSSSDWGSVSNDTYFFDKTNQLPYYKDAAGTVISIFESGGGNTIYTADDALTGNRIVDIGSNNLTFSGTGLTKIINGSKEVGINSWNTHAYWAINNGTTAWSLISANSSSVFNANEFGIANGSIVPVRIYNGSSVALGNVGKGSLNNSYKVQTSGDTLIGGDLHATDGSNVLEFDFNNYPKVKIGTASQEWWLIEGDGTGSTFDNGDLYFYDSTNSDRRITFKQNNGGTIIGNNKTLIGTEDISLQGETVIKGVDTLNTSTALVIYDGDGTPNKLWDFTNDGGLIGYASKTSLIAQNTTSNDINEYIFRLRNAGDTGNYFFVGNGGEVRLGKQTTDNSTGDKSTNNLWGEVVTKSGAGNYATLIGGNITANYTGERVVGLGRYIDITKERTVGIGGSVTISGDYSNGIGNTVTLGQFSHGVGTFITSSSTKNNLFGSFLDVTAQGAGVWGYGVNTANDLVNSTADSLALGWNSTTPQHLFFQTGAYIGGNSAIGTEDISLQGSVLITDDLDMNNNRITNAVINPSVQETASTATFTINADEETMGVLTAMAAATTIAAPTGTPVQGQKLMLRLKDDGTSRALTWNAVWRAIGVTLPAATTASKTLYIGAVYNSTDSNWDVIAVKEEA